MANGTQTQPAAAAPKAGKVLPDLQAELAALKARNAELEAAQAARTKVTIKQAEKGGVSVYGLQRFPVTLWAGQWVALLDQTQDGKAIRDFITKNKIPLEKPAKD